MVLQITVEDEDGNVLREVWDYGDCLRRLLPRLDDERYSLLRFIDVDGDTVFNRLQMQAVDKDLQVMSAQCSEDAGLQAIKSIRELAEMVSGEPHLYLKWYGE